MKERLITLVIVFTLCTPSLFAQNHPLTPKDGKVHIGLGGDTVTHNGTEVFNVLVSNAPKAPQYRNLPQFAIIGKNKKFYLSISGQLKITASFDWGNPLSSDPSAFTPSAITQAPAGNGAEVNFTAQRSSLSFNFVGLPGTENQIGVYVSFDFCGDNNDYGATLLSVYAQYRGFQAGYNLSMYLDQGACPYSIDAEGPNSSAGTYNTLFNYQGNITKNLSFGIGLESPMASYTTSTYHKLEEGEEVTLSAASSVTQRIPDIPLYLQYAWASSNHIRVAGLFRNLYYRDLIANKNKDVLGWGLIEKKLTPFLRG